MIIYYKTPAAFEAINPATPAGEKARSHIAYLLKDYNESEAVAAAHTGQVKVYHHERVDNLTFYFAGIRLSQQPRLICVVVKDPDAENCCFALEVTPHKYPKTVIGNETLRNQLEQRLVHFMLQRRAVYKAATTTPVPEDHIPQQLIEHNRRLIVLSTTQEKVLQALPQTGGLMCFGPPGAGKSVLAVAACQKYWQEQKLQVRFFAPRELLADQVRGELSNLNSEGNDAPAPSSTCYSEFLKAMDRYYPALNLIKRDGQQEVNLLYFTEWYTQNFVPKHGVVDEYLVTALFQEFEQVILQPNWHNLERLCLSLEEYCALGAQQAIFFEAEREEWYAKIFKPFFAHVTDARNNCYFPVYAAYNLYREFIQNGVPEQEQCDVVIVDEMQKYHIGPLACLLLLRRDLHGPFVTCGDPHQGGDTQRLLAAGSLVEYLKYKEINASICHVSSNHRNSANVYAFVQKLHLLTEVFLGSLERSTHVIPTQCIPELEGSVKLETYSAKLRDDIAANPEAYIVVPDERSRGLAAKKWPEDQIVTIEEFTGMPAGTVVMVGFFSKKYRQILAGLFTKAKAENIDLSNLGDTPSVFARKKGLGYEAYAERRCLQLLYTAASRAAKDLIIVSDPDQEPPRLIEEIVRPHKKALSADASKDKPPTQEKIPTLQEWFARAQDDFHNGLHKQALQILLNEARWGAKKVAAIQALKAPLSDEFFTLAAAILFPPAGGAPNPKLVALQQQFLALVSQPYLAEQNLVDIMMVGSNPHHITFQKLLTAPFQHGESNQTLLERIKQQATWADNFLKYLVNTPLAIVILTEDLKPNVIEALGKTSSQWLSFKDIRKALLTKKSWPDKKILLLTHFIRTRNSEAVQTLIQLGVKITTSHPSSPSPLCEAVLADDLSIARLLLQAGARSEYNPSPLKIAVVKNKPAFVRLLLEYNADLTLYFSSVLRDLRQIFPKAKEDSLKEVLSRNKIPIPGSEILAIPMGAFECAQILRHKEVENAILDASLASRLLAKLLPNFEKELPSTLGFCCHPQRSPTFFSTLLNTEVLHNSQKTTLNIYLSTNLHALKMFISCFLNRPYTVQSKNIDFRLFTANALNLVYIQKIQETQEFLENNPQEIEAPPLYIATICKDHRIILILLQLGANPCEKTSILTTKAGVPCHKKNRVTETPLFAAARAGDLATVILLAEYQCGVGDHYDQNHASPLCVAAGKGHSNVVAHLAKKVPAWLTITMEWRTTSENMVDPRDVTPLILAATMGHAKTVTVLLEALKTQPNVFNLTTQCGKTALAHAIAEGKQDVFDVLIKYPGVDLNAGSPDCIPLKVATQYTQPGMALALIKAGARIEPHGEEMLFFAIKMDDYDLAHTLICKRVSCEAATSSPPDKFLQLVQNLREIGETFSPAARDKFNLAANNLDTYVQAKIVAKCPLIRLTALELANILGRTEIVELFNTAIELKKNLKQVGLLGKHRFFPHNPAPDDTKGGQTNTSSTSSSKMENG